MKLSYKTSLLTFLFIFSISFVPTSTNGESINFSLALIYPSDVNVLDSIALNLEQALAPLQIDVQKQGAPRAVYLANLIDRKFDMAFLTVESFRNDFPPLWGIYSPDSLIGGRIYHTDDTQLLTNAGIDSDQLSRLMDNFKFAKTKADEIKIAKDIQIAHTRDWLMDIPLISPAKLILNWNEFQGYNVNDGIIKSILKGAYWNSNPSERDNLDRSTDTIHYLFSNLVSKINPILIFNRAERKLSEALFPSLLLFDGNNNPHPNLAKSFTYEEFTDNSSKWIFNIRDDVKWSDNTKITSKDIKFTLDLNKFEWVPTTNSESWEFLENVKILNDTSLSITFERATRKDLITIGKEFVIPEHILNTTGFNNGNQIPIYSGGDPFTSSIWVNFNINPITAGPFILKNINIDDSLDLTINPNYWYPSELDIDQEPIIFNNKISEPYFFKDINGDKLNTLNIKSIVFHMGGSTIIAKNSARIAFNSGSFDIIEESSIDVNDNILSNPSIAVSSQMIPSNGLVLLLNLRNIHLKNIDIRKALTLAIDRNKISTIVGFGQSAQFTPVSTFFPEYYDQTLGLEYNYEAARDIFVNNGYFALTDNKIKENIEYPWERVEINPITIFLSLIITSIVNRTFNRKFHKK